MNDALSLRNSLAEIGYEFTPESTTSTLRYVEKIRCCVREHPEKILKLAHLSEAQRQFLIQQFANIGKEVTFKELDDLIELLMEVYEQEHS